MRRFIFGLILVLATGNAAAHGYHNTTNNYYPTEQVITGPVGNDDFDAFMAMSAAGDTCVFDYAEGWQGCAGMGWYGNANAFNGSVVTRVDNFSLRFNLQADEDFDEFAGGFGGSWHF